jgi:alanyl-tRNA synthetase
MLELLVTYPAGSTAESSTVAAMTRVDGRTLFAVERTPCHPESPRWPDQPEDRCTLETSGTGVPIEVREGYLFDGELMMGSLPEGLDVHEDSAREAIPCVVHSVSAELAPAVGDRVELRVDESYRQALSRNHSRCHLVSLALNAALCEAWRKDPPARDSLGSPDFDKLAITSSKIDEHGSLDSYRVGRHLRKSGFSVEALSDPEALAQAVMDLAEGWLLSSPSIKVAPGECSLQERRTWSCKLPQGTASFPCGGTHPSAMEPDEGLDVEISWDPEERRLQMRAHSRTFHL